MMRRLRVFKRILCFYYNATANFMLRIYRWLKEDVSNMAIVDVKLVSGFTVNEESLENVSL